MKHSNTIYFLGNAHGIHVAAWVDILCKMSLSVRIFSVHRHGAVQKNNAIKEDIPDFLWRIPIVLRYILLGLYIRFFIKNKPDFFHAHNASGYGLMAYLSGTPYILTTYGSEIFQGGSRSWIYRYMIWRIVKKALCVTGTTRSMSDFLVREYNLNSEKIFIFSLGVGDVFHFSSERREVMRKHFCLSEIDPVFISNRRVSSHYNILLLVRAFRSVWEQSRKGLLLVLEGDGDNDYLKLVEKESSGCAGIKIIYGFKSSEDICNLLCAGDFSISIPISDQLSSSILESAACFNIPILNSIDSYDILFNSPHCIKLNNTHEDSIALVLRELVSWPYSKINSYRLEFNKFYASNFSKENAMECIAKLYEFQ